MPERSTADTPDHYVPKMTPGRVMYERWLAAQDVSPDDLWDYRPQHERYAWEALSGGSGEVPAGLTRLDLTDDERGALWAVLGLPPHPRTPQLQRALISIESKLRAALWGQEEPG